MTSKNTTQLAQVRPKSNHPEIKTQGIAQRAFVELLELKKKGSAGLETITKEFSLCKPLTQEYVCTETRNDSQLGRALARMDYQFFW